MSVRVIRLRKRIKARLVVAGLAVAAALSVAGLTAAGLTRSAPSWWRIYRPTPELIEHGAAVENAVISLLYRQRDADPAWAADPTGPWRSETWSRAIRDEDASAWLATRLPAWVEGHAEVPDWPDGLGKPQVRFDDGIVRIGVAYQRDGGERVVSANFRPSVRADGSVWLRTSWVHMGRLPVPAGLVLGQAATRLKNRLPESLADDPNALALARILAGDVPLAKDPVMHLEDGRAVRLLGVRVTPGRIELDLRTELESTLAKN
jgi:hypothetical protein